MDFIILLGSSLALESVLGAILWRTKAYRQFPLFAIHICRSFMSDVALMAVHRDRAMYFSVFWFTEAASVIVGLLALDEVFQKVFALFYGFWWFRLVFPSAVAIAELFSILHAIRYPPEAQDTTYGFILVLGTAARYIQAGTFALFFLLAAVFDIPWRRHAFGIALGFGIYAVVTLIAYQLRSEFGTKVNILYIYAPAVADLLRVGFWIYAFKTPESAGDLGNRSLPIPPEQLLAEIREYTKMMKRFLGKEQ